MHNQQPIVKNAADEGQLKEANVRVKLNRDTELNDIRFVLSDPRGRRFIWRLMGFCKTFNSIWEASAKIHYNSGKQDVGHFLMAEISEASEENYNLMRHESKGNK